MKKGLLFVMLFIMSIAAKAQDIVNNTNCDISITAVCYSPTTCQYSACGNPVVVPAGTTASIPSCPCSVASNLQGYKICWFSASTSCSQCATLGMCGMSSYPCPDFQATATLPACDHCTPAASGAHISCTSTGNIVVQ